MKLVPEWPKRISFLHGTCLLIRTSLGCHLKAVCHPLLRGPVKGCQLFHEVLQADNPMVGLERLQFEVLLVRHMEVGEGRLVMLVLNPWRYSQGAVQQLCKCQRAQEVISLVPKAPHAGTVEQVTGQIPGAPRPPAERQRQQQQQKQKRRPQQQV